MIQKKVISSFALLGVVLDIKKYGNGHINETYLITTSKIPYLNQEKTICNRYIMQSINQHVKEEPLFYVEKINEKY